MLRIARHSIAALALALICSPVTARAESPMTKTTNVEVPFLWSRSEAEDVCPRAAADAYGRWTGQWRMETPGKTSICEVADIMPPALRDIPVGPIWNQADAEKKCERVAAQVGGKWTGHWKTTAPGEMSVCNIAEKPSSKARNVDAGPIWNQADAELKCPVVAYAVRGRWTGQWVTTEQGRMSVCEIINER
jgi:hypothetical protein